MRSAAAFNACAVLTQDRHAPPESGTLAKSASGALEVVPWVRVVNLARALDEVAEAGYWRIGLAGEAETTLAQALPTGPVALVLGAEGDGMRHNIGQHCDALARLPISEAMESLNVSNAAAIALYAASMREIGEDMSMTATNWPRIAAKRIVGAGAIAALRLLLAACMLDARQIRLEPDLGKDGRFSFAYKGEIHFVSPSQLDEKKEGGEDKPDAKPAGKDAEAAQMEAMMGGMNLSDPKNAEEFARKLARQNGWRSVKSMGDGRFDVDYAISGTLTHDFTFPVIDGIGAGRAVRAGHPAQRWHRCG